MFELKPGYRIVVSDNRQVEIVNENGSPVEAWEAADLYCRLVGRYEQKLTIYIANGWRDERRGQHKIGVSNNPRRRASQLDANIMNRVRCSANYAWKIESALHRFLKSWCVGNEWYDFSKEGGAEILKALLSFETENQLVRWIPYEHWRK